MLTNNYHQILSKIQKICLDAGRKSDSVTLIPVSKTHPPEKILALYQAGIRDFAENRVQELLEKQSQLPADIRWHLIGSLQTNKVKYIAPFIHLIHSADRIDLLNEINRQAERNSRKIPVLLQVRIAAEETKHGCSPEELEALADHAFRLPHVEVKGAMAMATFTDDERQIAGEYNQFFNILPQQIKTLNNPVYSLGMTGDYHLAIRAGSTMVRIGSAIFGERNQD